MSLLNEMLHDLAKQKQGGTISPLYHTSLTERPGLLNRVPLIVGAIAIGGGVVLLATSFWLFSSSSDSAVVAKPQPTIVQEQVLVAKKVTSTQNLAPREPILVSYVAPLSAYANAWVSVDPALEASKFALNKVYAPQSLDDWHEAQLNKALKLIQQGDDDKALRLLEAILVRVPQALDARENLASLYLTYGDLANAQEVADEGLQYSPENASLLTIKARLFMAKDQSAEAAILLAKHRPSIEKYPDYYATFAAALQSSGQIDKAGSVYKSLLNVEPENGQYWLGYAIFLEHHHNINQAIDAYNRASQNPESESVVREYAENRLNHLQG